jgi:hypothetical protein
VVVDGLDANEVRRSICAAPLRAGDEDGKWPLRLRPFDAVREQLRVYHCTVDAALVAWSCLQRWEGRRRRQ